MTCIVGIEHRGKVWLGGDSAGTDGAMSQRVIGDPKVFKKGEFVFGVCGSPKVMNQLQHVIKFSKQEKDQNDREYIQKVFIPEFIAGLRSGECVSETNGGNAQFDGAILVGYRNKLYQVQGNFQVFRNAYGFEAVGSGAQIAIGSLQSTRGSWNVRKRIITALEASALNNATVRPPFNIVKY